MDKKRKLDAEADKGSGSNVQLSKPKREKLYSGYEQNGEEIPINIKIKSEPKSRPSYAEEEEVEDDGGTITIPIRLIQNENEDSDESRNYASTFDYCNYCGQCFSANYQLWTHITENHPLEFPVHCVHCNIGFKESKNQHSKLTKHLRAHQLNDDQFTCYFCQATFKTILLKIRHVRLHRELNNTSVDSPEFQELLRKIVTDRVHNHDEVVDTSSKPDPEPEIPADSQQQHSETDYKCRFSRCSKLFGGPSDLWNHLMRVHKLQENRFKYCELCYKKFLLKSPNYLLKLNKHHERVHNGPNNLLAMCFVCCKYFASQDERDEHVTLHKKLYGMPQREENFLTLLNEILNPPNAVELPESEEKEINVQKEEEPESSISPQLTKNQRRKLRKKAQESESGQPKPKHRKVKPFQCELCPKKFKEQYSMQAHTLAVHRSDDVGQEQECQFCKETFCTFVLLNVHMKTEHNFPCSVCGKTFSCDESVEQHLASKHGICE